MRIAQAALSLLVGDPAAWGPDWAWGLPLIVLTVVIHVTGLGLINQRVVRVSSGIMQHRYPTAVFVVIMGGTVLLVTGLHGIEAGIWPAAYHLLGALPVDGGAERMSAVRAEPPLFHSASMRESGH